MRDEDLPVSSDLDALLAALGPGPEPIGAGASVGDVDATSTLHPPPAPPPAVSSAGGRSSHGSHQVATVDVCPRLYDYNYLGGWVALAEKKFRLQGSLAHLCFAYYYASRMPMAPANRPPPSWFGVKDLNTALAELGAGHHNWCTGAKEALLHYLDEYKDDPIIPYAVEEEFWATLDEIDPLPPLTSWSVTQRPIVEPLYAIGSYVLTARIDLLALGSLDFAGAGTSPVLLEDARRVRSGALVLWNIDFKGRAGMYGKNRDKLEVWRDDGEFGLDWQSLYNLHILRVHFRREGVPWPLAGDVIQRFKREPPWDVARNVIDIPREAYALAPRRARWAVLKELEIQRWKAVGLEPLPNYWSCVARYGNCDFREGCRKATREQRLSWMESNCVRGRATPPTTVVNVGRLPVLPSVL